MLSGVKLTAGQQDDARMNLAVALTASRHGATVVNHVKVVNLLKGLDRVRVFKHNNSEKNQTPSGIFNREKLAIDILE